MIVQITSRMEEIFEFRAPDGKEYRFNATRLREFIRQNPHRASAATMPVDAAFIERVKGGSGIKLEKLERLSTAPKEILDEDPITVIMPDGTGLIVDGNHRAYLRYMAGQEFVNVLAVREDVWRRFLETGKEISPLIESNLSPLKRKMLERKLNKTKRRVSRP